MDTPRRITGRWRVVLDAARDADVPVMTESVHGTAIITSDLQYTLHG